MRRFPALIALVVLPLVAACNSSTSTTTATTTSAPPGSAPSGSTMPPGSVPPVAVVAGDVASLTGSAEPYGTGQHRGIELAAADLGSVTVVSADDRSSPAGGRAAMQQVIDAQAGAVLGPTLSPVAAEADKVAQAAGVPVLAVSNTTLDINAIGDMVWRVTLSENAMIPQAIAAAKKSKPFDRALLVWDESDDYAKGAAQAFRDGAERHDVTLAGDVALGADSPVTDVLRAVTSAGDPEVIFLAARGRRAIDLLQAADTLDLPMPLVGGNGFNSLEVLAGAGSSADGLIVAATWNIAKDDPANRNFVERYRTRYGLDPDAFVAQGYAGVQVLAAAAARGGGGSPAQVGAGLRQLAAGGREIDTLLGRLRFENREAVYPATVQVVRNGTFALFG